MYLLFYWIHFNMRSKFGCFWLFPPQDTGCKFIVHKTFIGRPGCLLPRCLFIYVNLHLVSSSFLRTYFSWTTYLSSRFCKINFVYFLVLLDWTSTSCAITFLVIWHIQCIMLACFTSKRSRYILQLFLIIDIYFTSTNTKKKRLVHSFPHCFLIHL